MLVYAELFSYLRLGLRAIKESEIGLAILHLSLDDYCNPRKVSGGVQAYVLLPKDFA